MMWVYALIREHLQGTPKKKEPEGFEWYDGSLEDQDEQQYPLYKIGEELTLYNPYMGAFLVDYETETPMHYAVVAVQYDELSDVYRYKLSGFSDVDWVSEDWLSRPVVSSFKRTYTASKEDIGRDLAKLERIYEIDRLLDVINIGSAEEKAKAEQRLKELTDD